MNAGKRFLGQVAGLVLQVGGRAAASAVKSVVKDGKRATKAAQKRLSEFEQQLLEMVVDDDDPRDPTPGLEEDEIIAEVVTPRRTARKTRGSRDGQ